MYIFIIKEILFVSVGPTYIINICFQSRGRHLYKLRSITFNNEGVAYLKHLWYIYNNVVHLNCINRKVKCFFKWQKECRLLLKLSTVINERSYTYIQDESGVSAGDICLHNWLLSKLNKPWNISKLLGHRLTLPGIQLKCEHQWSRFQPSVGGTNFKNNQA